MTSIQTLTDLDSASFEPTKTVGLISDTHVPKRATIIPRQVFDAFKNVDYIIHAGDLVELPVIDQLEQVAPVLAVQGNMDDEDVKNFLPELNSLKVFEWKIGVMHDPDVLNGSDKMLYLAKENCFNALVYGHTHSPRIKWEGEVLFVNPGSPTDPASFLNKPSVALLQITKEKIVPRIIEINP